MGALRAEPLVGLRNRGTSRLVEVIRNISRVPVLPGTILTAFVFGAVFADVLALHSPTAVDLGNTFAPPAWETGGSWTHPFGTDSLGRDMYSRLVHGSRLGLFVGTVVVCIAATVGTTLAMVSGYMGKWVDAIVQRIVDGVYAMPFLLVAIVLAAILGPSLRNLILILALGGWTSYARVIRGEVLRLREADFVAAAKVAGVPTPIILYRHIFPNVRNTMIVLATLELGGTILAAASLGFLGVGVPPEVPTWGGMLSEGRPYVASAWWITFFPGVAISLTVLGANLMGDWLRWRFDPKFRQV